AKNVILVDTTTTRPEGAHPPRLLSLPLPNAPPGATGFVWGVAKTKDAGPMADARAKAIEAAKDEYRRLLYVGLTRAAERLVVCGTKGVNSEPEGCWHRLVLDALKPDSQEETDSDGQTVWRFRKIEAATRAEPSAPEPKIEVPGWLRLSAKAEKPKCRILRPSDTGEYEEHVTGASNRNLALRRGTLVHRLMQSLPDIPPERRAEAACRYLARNGKDFDEAARETMAQQTIALLSHPDFAALFAPGSRAEVSIAGKLDLPDGPVLVAGQIDRW
ncbi:MAG: double-strand break repair helicase AddA, partial [Pseudolabrys sp.]|nr:double-strand break repair helicase AddA [Pseudolabrys sp.]